MALAAQPQMHFPSRNPSKNPSWDENIVPVLRQRLQNESQMLTKRLSTHSITSSDAAKAAAASASAQSKLPRPSLSQDRQHYNTISTASSSVTPAKKRQRTNSSPFTSPTTPAAPVDHRVSRIPKVSNKTSTSSSQGHSYHPYRPSGLSSSTNASLTSSHNSTAYHANSLPSRTKLGGRKEYMEPPSPSLDPPSDTGISMSSKGTKGANGRGYIPYEEPPFPNSANGSAEFHYEQTRLVTSQIHGSRSGSLRGLHATALTTGPELDGRRMSIDEGNESSDRERPFEHWYRGEAARNGGVGELRMGRAEMMDIAKFGHKTAPSPSKRVSPLGFGEFGGRRRAGSFDEKRESWVAMEVDGVGRVIDESPLTDLEGDEYTTEGERSYPYPAKSGVNGLGVSGPSSGSRMHSRNASEDIQEETLVEDDTILSTTPTALVSIHTSVGKNGAVTPAKGTDGRPQASPPSGGSKTPLGANNGTSKAEGHPSSGKSGQKGKARSQPRSRHTSKPTAPENPEEEEDPILDGLEEEKIPYRRPPAKGNWDDIVLPAVSKKMGIEGYGLKSEDGIMEVSEEVRKRMSAIQAPVPGLFGYDLSKYKPAQPEEDINMAELGVSQPSPPATPKAKPDTPSENVPVIGGRESPLAFSHYPIADKPIDSVRGKRTTGNKVPQIMVSPPSTDEHRRPPKEKDEHGGCCGCVIM